MTRPLRGLAIIGSILVIGLLADEWIISVAVAVLFIGLRYLARQQGPPVIAAAFCNQWLQVTVGIIWFGVTGRAIREMRTPEYRPMMIIGLACVVVLFTGFYLASGLGRNRPQSRRTWRQLPWTTNQVAAVYAGTVAASGILAELAWSTPGFTQVLLVFSRVRYVLLFLLITRLVRPIPRWPWIFGILGMEVGLGFTQFFADFREPLVVAALAVLGAMDRKLAKTWMTLGGLALLAIGSGLLWTAIKPVLRKNYVSTVNTGQRLNAVFAVTGTAFGQGAGSWKVQADNMVSRLWAVYFAGLALKRVPTVLPYENGAILRGAVSNVFTPRIFFPEKPMLPSQSEEVRKYSGIWVGGRESNTSYAFGYAGESYVDFGIPLMYLPIFVFGLLMGFAYRGFERTIRHDELKTGVIVVAFWAMMSVYEASWVMMIGPSITLLIVLGGSAVFLDRIFTAAEKDHARTRPRQPTESWAAPDRQLS